MIRNEEEITMTYEDYGPIYELTAKIAEGDAEIIFLLLCSVIREFDRKLGREDRPPIADIINELLSKAIHEVIRPN